MSRLRQYLSTTPADRQHPETIAYLASLDVVEKVSPGVSAHVIQELRDQRSYLKLIASENYCSPAVQLAMGNLLTDKYAEGYSHHRFYAGCGNVDAIETEAAEGFRQLFGADHAYVQPHSGADANLVAFWAILLQRVQNTEIQRLGKKTLEELTPEEAEQTRKLMVSQKMMGMALESGGHLTHGFRHNISSKIFQAVSYAVDPKTELLDYSALAAQVRAEKPLILLAGYSSYSRKINFAKMREIADSVGAVLMVDMAHFAGLVAGKVFTGDYNPIPFAQMVTSTTHKTLRGPRGGLILCQKEFQEAVDKGCPLVLGGPLPHVMAAKAVAAREANAPTFPAYAQKIVANAQTLSERLMAHGIRVVSGGTDNHLMVFDVRPFGLTGRQAEEALRETGITANRNTIPYDTQGAWYTSGVRIGTPATTTLGMGAPEMGEIADMIFETISQAKPATTSSGAPSRNKCDLPASLVDNQRQRVRDLLSRFPLYPELQL